MSFWNSSSTYVILFFRISVYIYDYRTSVWKKKNSYRVDYYNYHDASFQLRRFPPSSSSTWIPFEYWHTSVGKQKKKCLYNIRKQTWGGKKKVSIINVWCACIVDGYRAYLIGFIRAVRFVDTETTGMTTRTVRVGRFAGGLRKVCVLTIININHYCILRGDRAKWWRWEGSLVLSDGAVIVTWRPVIWSQSSFSMSVNQTSAYLDIIAFRSRHSVFKKKK